MEDDNQIDSEAVQPMDSEEAGSGGHTEKQEDPPKQSSQDEPPATQTSATSDPAATPEEAAEDPTKATESNNTGSTSDDTGATESSSEKPGQDDDNSSRKDPNTGRSSEKEPAVDESAVKEQSATTHVFDESWSKLPKDEIVDKVKGVIYGQAIGDAFGLATEFLSRKAAKKHYKTGPSGYSDIIQDFHRSRWDKGDWTDDTDQMLLILQMINDNQGKVDRIDFAKRLYDWMQYGFRELGDYGGMGIGMTVHRTLTHPTFLTDPHASAEEVWDRSGRYLAANGAIMRTSILGVLNFSDIPKVVTNTTEISKVTHADPRCTASCIAVTTAIAMMLRGDYDLKNEDGLKSLVEAAIKEGEKVLKHSDQKEELKTHITSSLEGLKLDEQQSIGYTFKALGAGFYGLRNSMQKSFRDIILEVIMQAGDADSNGAVCGALVGCVVGFKALPEDLLKFPHRTWLDQQVDKFLKTIGLKDQ